MVTPRSKAAAAVKQPRTLREFIREPSTWAGLLTIGSALATGGVTLPLSAPILTQVAAGLALVFTKEAR